jgi:hypothetical protein
LKARKKMADCAVIASKAKQSRLGDCVRGVVWIASLTLAMTAPRNDGGGSS